VDNVSGRKGFSPVIPVIIVNIKTALKGFLHCWPVSRPVLALFLTGFLFSGFARAEMISTQKIAFADIEKIYSRFRMKELAEKEIGIRKEKYLSEIAAMNGKIRQLEASMALEEEVTVTISTPNS